MEKTRSSPQTTLIRPKGICGHLYERRVPLPVAYAKKPYTPTLRKRIEEWKYDRAKELRHDPCGECQAEDSIEIQRTATQEWATWLNVQALPPIEGSKKLVAYAESVRLEALMMRLSDEIRNDNANRYLSTPASILLLKLLQQQWSEVEWVEPNLANPLNHNCPAAEKLKESRPKHIHAGFAGIVGRDVDSGYLIKTWLNLRAAWPTPGEFYYETDSARAWIGAKRKGRLQDFTRTISNHNDPLAVRIVSSIAMWETPMEAWMALQTLQNGSNPSVLPKVLEEQPDLGLLKSIEYVATLNALSRDRNAQFEPPF